MLESQTPNFGQFFSQILNNAISADGIVKGKYNENKEGFLMLSKGEVELSSSLPSASPAAAFQGSPVVAGTMATFTPRLSGWLTA